MGRRRAGMYFFLPLRHGERYLLKEKVLKMKLWFSSYHDMAFMTQWSLSYSLWQVKKNLISNVKYCCSSSLQLLYRTDSFLLLIHTTSTALVTARMTLLSMQKLQNYTFLDGIMEFRNISGYFIQWSGAFFYKIHSRVVCSSNNVIFKWEEEGEQAKQSSVESVLSARLVEKPEVRRRRQWRWSSVAQLVEWESSKIVLCMISSSSSSST